jgi:hypothetical protein
MPRSVTFAAAGPGVERAVRRFSVAIDDDRVRQSNGGLQ